MAYWSAMRAVVVAGWWLVAICAKKRSPKKANSNELEEDENDGYLCNGGDSDPAETTVGKPAIS